MTAGMIEVQGAEGDVRAFRDELMDLLRRQGIGSDQVIVSMPRSAKRPLTEPAPLGHAEWMELFIDFVVPVATAGATTLVTELVKTWTKSKRITPKSVKRKNQS